MGTQQRGQHFERGGKNIGNDQRVGALCQFGQAGIEHDLVVMCIRHGGFDCIRIDINRIHLNRSYLGLYLPPMTWRELDNFSSGSVCMVLASERYDEADYLRDYSDFMVQVHGNRRKTVREAACAERSVAESLI